MNAVAGIRRLRVEQNFYYDIILNKTNDYNTYFIFFIIIHLFIYYSAATIWGGGGGMCWLQAREHGRVFCVLSHLSPRNVCPFCAIIYLFLRARGLLAYAY